MKAFVISECSPRNPDGKPKPIRVLLGPDAREKAKAWIVQEEAKRSNDTYMGETWTFNIDPVEIDEI